MWSPTSRYSPCAFSSCLAADARCTHADLATSLQPRSMLGVSHRSASCGRCDLSDFCRTFCLTLLAFPLQFLSFSSFFSRIMYAETHRVLPCAQVMRCHGCRVPWLRCGSLRKPQTGGCTNIKNKTTNRCPAPPVSLSPCLPVSLPPCRPAGQGASPCVRLRAMQSAKALYRVQLYGLLIGILRIDPHTIRSRAAGSWQT